MTNMIRIEDAKALKQLGASYDTPIEDCEFTAEGGKRYAKVWDSCSAFWDRIYAYAQAPGAKRFERTKKSFAKLCRSAEDLDAYLDELSEHDGESVIFVAFLTTKVAPFIAQWEAIFDALNCGDPVQLSSPKSKDDPWEF